MPVDFQVFKNNLINRGIDWSDQQILDYIAAQEDKQVTQPIMQDDLSGEIFNVIQKWEYKDSERSQSHNNPGGHIWTPELEADFGAKKGKHFVSKTKEGKDSTFWTAKYDSLEQGKKASLFVTNNVINRVVTNTGLKPNEPEFGEAFAKEYSGSADPTTIRNYGGDISRAISNYTNNMPAATSMPKQTQQANIFDWAGDYKPP